MPPGRRTLTCISAVIFLYIPFYAFKRHITKHAIHTKHAFLNVTSAYNCSREMALLNLEKAYQDDARLIYAIKKCFVEPPSSLPYKLSQKIQQSYAQAGQDEFVDNILNYKMNEFFIESGAFDGEALSNSLLFELHRGWTGLLIEPLSKEFNALKLKHRKSFAINACISLHPYPMKVELSVAGYLSRVNDEKKSTGKEEFESVQCLPFYSMLLAIGRTQVDFFSLDIEGDELTVLKTIPWNKVDIKVLIVEYNHIIEGKEVLIEYMKDCGYTDLPELAVENWQDIVFVKKGLSYNKDFIASLSIILKKSSR